MENEIFSQVAEAIRSLRSCLGKTQLQFAPLIKVTSFTLSRFETGTNMPKPNTLVKLKELAGVKFQSEANVFERAIIYRAGRKKLDRPTPKNTVFGSVIGSAIRYRTI